MARYAIHVIFFISLDKACPEMNKITFKHENTFIRLIHILILSDLLNILNILTQNIWTPIVQASIDRLLDIQYTIFIALQIYVMYL